MKNNVMLKLVLYDFKMGFLSNRFKYFVVCIFFAFISFMFYREASIKDTVLDFGPGSVTDCLIYIFKGMKVYTSSPLNDFELPLAWLIMQSLLCILISFYPAGDVNSYGSQILVKSGSKTRWWLSKCVWTICTVNVYYLLGYISVYIVSTILGHASFGVNEILNMDMNGMKFDSVDNLELLMALIVLPVTSSLAISMVQNVLSFILNPTMSIVLIFCGLVISAYYYSPISIGNHSMLLRNGLFYDYGFNMAKGLISNIIIIFLAALFGSILFNRYEVIKKI
ncbi:hypothetical protein [Parasporobacterium paucivorans]|uniref:ABC-2 family transporter protein n=1 Tax=Parasporobacterium paucivorans DSM 15970 TaxID=1122934 RepID=A0A1M6KP61_9FIRM|nr:hypothetical protein [Parasporobacterium paucivorans]SHJ60747.1 hypothetical protein SAMN02745691_02238 [Parasporobacterium paucivorans DSM 15970]